jgi:hypothetical protein
MSDSNTDFDMKNINYQAPVNEPDRQYYYIENLRNMIKTKSELIGRPLTYSITTFGCRKVSVAMISRNTHKTRRSERKREFGFISLF